MTYNFDRNIPIKDKLRIAYCKCLKCNMSSLGWYRNCDEHGPMKNSYMDVALWMLLTARENDQI